MYRIAEAKGVENLIAGAWGCGVFMQDPSMVATLLVNAARNYNIPNIYFAILAILEFSWRFWKNVQAINYCEARLKYVSRETCRTSFPLLFFWKSYIGEVKKLLKKETVLCIIQE